MRDIVELFTDPEVCAEEMIWGNSTKTIGKGIIIIAQAALLIGLIGTIGLKAILPDLITSVPKIGFVLLDNLNSLSNMNFGVLSIIVAFAVAILITAGVLLKALMMAGVLFIMKFLVRGTATFKQLFLITVFSQVISVSLILIGAICAGVSIPYTTDIVEIILGLVMFFQYWYLIFTVIGFKTANRVGVIRSIAAVLMMQGIWWGLQYALLGRAMLF